MIESASGKFVFECVDGLWGREDEGVALYPYTKALILASELIRPGLPLYFVNCNSKARYHSPLDQLCVIADTSPVRAPPHPKLHSDRLSHH